MGYPRPARPWRTTAIALATTAALLVTGFVSVALSAASPDGTRLYVGGDFTNVGGTGRSRIVAYNTANGAIINSFAANANNYVTALVATSTSVYLGGIFGQVSGVLRSFLAEVNASNG